MTVVFLDAGPLGQATNPNSSAENDACSQWLEELVAKGTRIVVAEVADYEVRRELLRLGKTAGLKRLDTLYDFVEYMPISTVAMRTAADLWASVRRLGKPTASDTALDGDVILAAQALTSGVLAADIVVATTNVAHLSRLVTAAHWRNISI